MRVPGSMWIIPHLKQLESEAFCSMYPKILYKICDLAGGHRFGRKVTLRYKLHFHLHTYSTVGEFGQQGKSWKNQSTKPCLLTKPVRNPCQWWSIFRSKVAWEGVKAFPIFFGWWLFCLVPKAVSFLFCSPFFSALCFSGTFRLSLKHYYHTWGQAFCLVCASWDRLPSRKKRLSWLLFFWLKPENNP